MVPKPGAPKAATIHEKSGAVNELPLPILILIFSELEHQKSPVFSVSVSELVGRTLVGHAGDTGSVF